jgi:hypothetical protein
MGVITTLADRASEAEAGIGEGGEWIAGAAGSGSPPPMEHGVALDHVMEPVAKECYTYTRSWPAAPRPPRATNIGECLLRPPTPPSR